MKKIIIYVITILVLCIGLASATTFETKIELELTGLTGISQIDNSDGTSVKVTIHNATSIVVSRDAAAGVYKSGMVIPMTGSKFSMDYATDYTYNLSTIYGDFLYNFTTPAEPATGGAELHTGQTTSYGTGDDANLDSTSKSYTSNGCGTGTVLDDHTGLCWQYDDPSGTYTWAQALTYCNNLNLGGHTDWRLPTSVEGITMMDYSCDTAAPDHCYSDFQNNALDWSTSNSYYWTSTTRPEYTGDAYGLSVDVGTVYVLDKSSSSRYFRCVRSE
ncbi:MAG: DUF1566 domain-containing protein [Nanoarchaeota archaeon]|nr:DUF1566 domain-containing protein [Nanoarchaeota archaeon]